MSKNEDEKDGKTDKSEKPKFYSRVFAYLFDGFIVMLLATFLVFPFVDSSEYIDLMEESNNILEKYSNDEINDNEYRIEIVNLKYKLDKSMELLNIMTILVGVLYFVVYPLYHEGKTFGKRLAKIRVISTKGDLTANQLIFRSFIANSILLRILMVLFIMFASRSVYDICTEILYDIQYIIVIVSMFMIIYGKEGLAIHDRLTYTKVIKTN